MTPDQPASDLGEQGKPDPGAALSVAALERRRLLLRSVGKGSVALAALAPLASQATRSYTLANPDLPGGAGYCSVSGFQSAAISLAPGQAPRSCSAPGPATYFETKDVVAVFGPNPPSLPNNINQAVRRTVRDLEGDQNLDVPAGTLNNLGETKVIGSSIYIHLTSTVASGAGSVTIRQIKKSSAFPDAVANVKPLAGIDSAMLNVTDFQPPAVKNTVLYTLYNHENDIKAYFAAVLLGCIVEDGSFQRDDGFKEGSIPFDAKYVSGQYENNFGPAGDFFRRLCAA